MRKLQLDRSLDKLSSWVRTIGFSDCRWDLSATNAAYCAFYDGWRNRVQGNLLLLLWRSDSRWLTCDCRMTLVPYRSA